MIWLLVLALVLLCIFSLNFRIVLFNLPFVVFYCCVDLYYYFKHKKKNVCPTGKLVVYEGLFGKGKTLTGVHDVVEIYEKYNDKMIYDRERKKFVTQKIKILSNVELKDILYEKLQSLEQVLRCAQNNKKIDFENDTLTVVIVFIDEAGAELNSRNFKKNINGQMLNVVLCERHYHMSMFFTSQRFKHIDALLRQVTQEVINCDKLWRLQRLSVYDAFQYENISDITKLKPIYKRGFFVRNKDYNAYDTLAVVDMLIKSWEDGDMLSDEEILALQCNNSINVDVDTKSKNRIFGRKRRA